jgi:hypothetical protein
VAYRRNDPGQPHRDSVGELLVREVDSGDGHARVDEGGRVATGSGAHLEQRAVLLSQLCDEPRPCGDALGLERTPDPVGCFLVVVGSKRPFDGARIGVVGHRGDATNDGVRGGDL